MRTLDFKKIKTKRNNKNKKYDKSLSVALKIKTKRNNRGNKTY